MRIERRELKRRALEAMRAASPNAIFMTFLYLLLTTGVSWVVGRFAADPLGDILHWQQQGVALDRAIGLMLRMVGRFGMFLTLLMGIWNVVVKFGYKFWCLGTVRGEQGETGDLMTGFSMVGRILWLQILVLMYGLLWYVAIFVPAGFAVGLGAVVWMRIPVVGIPLCTGIFVLAFALWFSRVLRYSMAEFCLMDEPQMGASWALRRSRVMMQGRVKDYVFLVLSFIGWFLLASLITTAVEGALVLAVGGMQVLTDPQVAQSVGSSWLVVVLPTLACLPLSLWLKPYVTMTQCNFYEQIKGGKEGESV